MENVDAQTKTGFIPTDEEARQLQETYPIDQLGVDAKDLQALREGRLNIPAGSWVSRFRNSELNDGPAEQWLGKQLLEPSLLANSWVAIPEPADQNRQKIVEAGYARSVTAPDGSRYFMPIAKFAGFVKSRFAPVPAPR